MKEYQHDCLLTAVCCQVSGGIYHPALGDRGTGAHPSPGHHRVPRQPIQEGRGPQQHGERHHLGRLGQAWPQVRENVDFFIRFLTLLTTNVCIILHMATELSDLRGWVLVEPCSI